MTDEWNDWPPGGPAHPGDDTRDDEVQWDALAPRDKQSMSKTHDPISGPLSRDELKALAGAPYGKAAAVIRKHDPLFGRNGEAIKWLALFTGRAQCRGHATIKAASKEEAENLARKLSDVAIDWEVNEADDVELVEVEAWS